MTKLLPAGLLAGFLLLSAVSAFAGQCSAPYTIQTNCMCGAPRDTTTFTSSVTGPWICYNQGETVNCDPGCGYVYTATCYGTCDIYRNKALLPMFDSKIMFALRDRIYLPDCVGNVISYSEYLEKQAMLQLKDLDRRLGGF